MKKIHLFTIFFAAYHISSFASEHQIIEYNNRFPQISEEELNKRVAESELKIKENQARYKEEQEQRIFDCYLKHHRNKNQRRQNF